MPPDRPKRPRWPRLSAFDGPSDHAHWYAEARRFAALALREGPTPGGGPPGASRAGSVLTQIKAAGR